MYGSLSARRAWIEIASCWRVSGRALWSLSARRAWIEIVEFHLFASSGVSLSARRAWIEITVGGAREEFDEKSLSARRAWIEIVAGVYDTVTRDSRSPQGERG